MSADLKTAAVETETRVDNTAATKAAPASLGWVLAEIGRDSRTAPRRYLDETVVPHGGE